MKKKKLKYSSPEMEKALEAAKRRGEFLKRARRILPERMQRQFTI